MRTRHSGSGAGLETALRSRGLLLSLALAGVLVLLTAAGVSAPAPDALAEGPFSFDTVVAKAQALSRQPYVQPRAWSPTSCWARSTTSAGHPLQDRQVPVEHREASFFTVSSSTPACITTAPWPSTWWRTARPGTTP
jgi:hypothetical protein